MRSRYSVENTRAILAVPAEGWRRGAVVGASLLALVFPFAAHAGQPLNPPVPLADQAEPIPAGTAGEMLAAAQRAQEVGLPTVAISLYEQLLASPAADRAPLSLALASALLDAGRADDAERVLNASPGPHGPEWRLRIGLAAAQQRRFDVARDQLDHINVDELLRPDRSWFWFLQGFVADAGEPRDVRRANERYQTAEKDAPNEYARATFLAAEQRIRLSFVTYSPAEVEQLRRAYEAELQRGRPAYQLAQDYAVRLTGIGRKNEAEKFVTDVLLRIPRAERQWSDRFHLLLGLIGGRQRGGAGRNALNQLLEQGSTVDLQRQALMILVRDSARDPERGLFRAELDKLIGATPKSPILDAVLLMRAQLALVEKDYATAERRANELKDDFPGSSLRPNALALLASSAWEQYRYRVAADEARLAREALAATPGATARYEKEVVAQATGELLVFEAEARFRAGDYRLATEAYAAALRQPPAGIEPGDLMFQRALASIKADENDPSADLVRLVDEIEADPRFDARNRWETEWNLARGLKVQNKVDAALARVTRLLDTEQKANVTPELRARMRWLQVRLSSDAGDPKLTLQLVPKLQAATAGLAPELRGEIASAAALLTAEAQFKLNADDPAHATLEQLRHDYPQSDAALYSYIVEATHYAEPGRDEIQRAQTTLRKLIDDPRYQHSRYVPYALFQLALLYERLGQEKDLRDANQAIEDLVRPDRNASDDLVFTARLKQGDLLRTLNDFPRAQVAYEDLVNNPRYVRRPDVVVAQLRLAECHNAQSSTDPSGSHADIAQSMFEELLYRVAAPPDVRVEAGYNLGKILERRGLYEKARNVWFTDVITPFLLDAKPFAATRATVPYWLARTLLDLGALLEQRENVDEARRTYVLLRDSNLGYGESIARERLQRLGIPATSGATAPAPQS